MKRLLDIIGASCGLIVLSPVVLVVAILVRLQMGSPIFFVQARTGIHTQLFYIIKFRTMLNATDKNGHPLSEGDRITPLGQTLRSTSLDELPELWNVLKGEMSLVGPRPLLPEYVPLYSEEQSKRHDLPPGLTGWAQINGRNTLSWPDKFALDVWYVENRTLSLDLKIIALTVVKIFKRESISAAGEATMPRFRGER